MNVYSIFNVRSRFGPLTSLQQLFASKTDIIFENIFDFFRDVEL
jgi:hypothetical protein